MTAMYLAKLNTEQRRAVEHGGASLDGATPLLIIAGAGSGKTNTLAHRVAHLIVGGADPRRIMMLTFSRRAASEMQRGRAHYGASSWCEDGPRTRLVWNISRDRRAPSSRLRAGHWLGPGIHNP